MLRSCIQRSVMPLEIIPTTNIMKRFFLLTIIIAALQLQSMAKKTEKPMTVVAYVTSWTRVMPDPQRMTHINYAFGHVNETFNGVRIDNPDRLRSIVELKKQNPKLKVMLSVGGWGSGRFSEMAATKENRKAFAKDCKRVVDEFALDGIDIDWEYPTQNSAGISCSPDDTKNFTLLMAELRKHLGRHLLLTAATVADAKFIDFKSCIGYMDFVNVMAYDMGNAPRHHSSLYPSERSGYMTSSGAVEAHLKAGVPRDKLVLGLAFYGKGSHKDGLGNYVKTRRLDKKYREKWDDKGKVPYIVNEKDELVLGFDNTRSLAIKCQYILDNRLRGGMYWEYGDDNAQGDESRTVWLSLLKEKKGVEAPRRILVLAERGGLHEGFTAAALKWLSGLAPKLNAEMVVLESAKNIKAGEIDSYHLILQLNYPPFAWSKASQEDLQRYIDKGLGGYIGFHHASLLGEFEGYGLWDWFSQFMGNILYNNYIAETTDGVVQTEDTDHPVMKNVPATFTIESDEWYTYNRNPRKEVHVLAHVDECSYKTDTKVKMGDHPVIWTNTQKPARNVYFQFGHSKALLENAAFLQMFENALHWTLRDK